MSDLCRLSAAVQQNHFALVGSSMAVLWGWGRGSPPVAFKHPVVLAYHCLMILLQAEDGELLPHSDPCIFTTRNHCAGITWHCREHGGKILMPLRYPTERETLCKLDRGRLAGGVASDWCFPDTTIVCRTSDKKYWLWNLSPSSLLARFPWSQCDQSIITYIEDGSHNSWGTECLKSLEDWIKVCDVSTILRKRQPRIALAFSVCIFLPWDERMRNWRQKERMIAVENMRTSARLGRTAPHSLQLECRNDVMQVWGSCVATNCRAVSKWSTE